jgi:hypothetical protein
MNNDRWSLKGLTPLRMFRFLGFLRLGLIEQF